VIASFSTPPHAKLQPVPVVNPIGLATEAESRNLLFYVGRLQLGLVGVVGLFRSRATLLAEILALFTKPIDFKALCSEIDVRVERAA
jgi:hypothetical protein